MFLARTVKEYPNFPLQKASLGKFCFIMCASPLQQDRDEWARRIAKQIASTMA